MNKMQDSTIVDIAEKLNLSIATVSRALNNDPKVKDSTRKRVLETASKIGYQRNALASGLRSKKSHTVGLIVPRISMFFHAEVITEIQNLLHAQGYNLVICQSNDNPNLEKELAHTLYASRVDAVIVACTLHNTDFSHFDIFQKSETPVIFYDRIPDYPAHSVRGDDYGGGFLAGEHLAKLGCKRPALISGPLNSNLYRDRSEGFMQALKQFGIQISANWLCYHELTPDNVKASINMLFSQSVKPDALFTANDTSAIQALQFARVNNISVPQDLKIIGYSNDPRSAIITPTLTTVEQFPRLVGARVVEQLMEIFREKQKGEASNFHSVTTSVELIRRMSA